MLKREKKGSKRAGLRSGNGPRQRKLTRRQKKAKAKSEIKSRKPLLGSFRLSWLTLKTIRRYWKPLGGIVLAYLILNIILASGISSLSATVSDIKFNLNEADSNNLSPIATAIDGFGSLVGSAGTNSSSTGSALQSILIVVESLVIIWALRHLLAGQKIRVKQAYYNSTAQLIPFLLVVAVIFIQLLPVVLGAPIARAILTSAFPNGGGGAVTLMVLMSAVLIGWSLYMLSSSIVALYIVTLPDMHPRRALRSAKDLVRFRRFSIMRRLIFLPIFVLLAMATVVIPLILSATFLVAPVFFGLSMLSLLFANTYLYSLYRELIS